MKLIELLKKAQIPYSDSLIDSLKNLSVSDVTHKSEEVREGSLFIAVEGSRFDGHQMLKEVAQKGAIAALVEKKVSAPIPKIHVAATKEALIRVSQQFYGDPTSQLVVIGVTGTNGKTTFTFLMESILKAAGFRPGVIGTINCRFGEETWSSGLTTPDAMTLQKLCARMRDKGATHLVMEVSSHSLDQGRVAGCHFDQAVFTNLTQDHLDYHGDMEGYFTAKSRFFNHYLPASAKLKKMAVVNREDPFGQRLCGQISAPYCTYGWGEGADFYAENIILGLDGTSFYLHTPLGGVKMKTPLIGRHNVANILAAVAAASGLSMDLATIAEGVQSLVKVPGRLERIPHDRIYVFVDYAHTDDALTHVLTNLKSLKGSGTLITVFGCGGDRDKTKRPLMGRAVGRLSDAAIITSDNPRGEDPLQIISHIEQGMAGLMQRSQSVRLHEYHVEVDRKKAIWTALSKAVPGDIVLIAGKGHETEQEISGQRFPFDDRRVAEEALECLHPTKLPIS